ncbi:MAG: hypothetical protein GY699_07345 [Desulfobacteraceae bacterium]|nr:hypothetical protein [Desulfobacteraceae bacterium]
MFIYSKKIFPIEFEFEFAIAIDIEFDVDFPTENIPHLHKFIKKDLTVYSQELDPH